MPRLTFFKWDEVKLGKIQVVTPKEGEPDPGVITPELHIKKALGFNAAARKNDERPVLVYFHYPHDDKAHGKLSTTICSRTLDDETAARWSLLFRCVQIDMGETETEYAELIGSTGKPGFVALDEDLKVVATLDPSKSASKLRKSLEKAFQKFPAARKELKQLLKEQGQWMDEAKRLEKAKEYEDALELVDKIRFGNVRVGSDWAKAYAYGMLLARKAEKADRDD
jgi:hypothetical protein